MYLKATGVIGFDEAGNEETTTEHKTNKKQKSGGFQQLGLSYPVLKGVMKRGYKVPTPIQRKVSVGNTK